MRALRTIFLSVVVMGLLVPVVRAEGDVLWVAIGEAGGEAREGWRAGVCAAYGISGIQSVVEKKRPLVTGTTEEFRFPTGQIVRVGIREREGVRYLLDVEFLTDGGVSLDVTVRLGRGARFVFLDRSIVLVMEIR